MSPRLCFFNDYWENAVRVMVNRFEIMGNNRLVLYIIAVVFCDNAEVFKIMGILSSQKCAERSL